MSNRPHIESVRRFVCKKCNNEFRVWFRGPVLRFVQCDRCGELVSEINREGG